MPTMKIPDGSEIVILSVAMFGNEVVCACRDGKELSTLLEQTGWDEEDCEKLTFHSLPCVVTPEEKFFIITRTDTVNATSSFGPYPINVNIETEYKALRKSIMNKLTPQELQVLGLKDDE